MKQTKQTNISLVVIPNCFFISKGEAQKNASKIDDKILQTFCIKKKKSR